MAFFRIIVIKHQSQIGHGALGHSHIAPQLVAHERVNHDSDEIAFDCSAQVINFLSFEKRGELWVGGKIGGRVNRVVGTG